MKCSHGGCRFYDDDPDKNEDDDVKQLQSVWQSGSLLCWICVWVTAPPAPAVCVQCQNVRHCTCFTVALASFSLISLKSERWVIHLLLGNVSPFTFTLSLTPSLICSFSACFLYSESVSSFSSTQLHRYRLQGEIDFSLYAHLTTFNTEKHNKFTQTKHHQLFKAVMADRMKLFPMYVFLSDTRVDCEAWV